MSSAKKLSPMEISIPADPEFLRIVRLLISGYGSRLSISLDEVENLKVAVSEACNSIIHHAGKDDTSKEAIRIKCWEQAGQVVFEIKDKGIQVDKSDFDDDEIAERGLGFLLIQTLMDEVDVKSNPEKGTRITMRKKISAA